MDEFDTTEDTIDDEGLSLKTQVALVGTSLGIVWIGQTLIERYRYARRQRKLQKQSDLDRASWSQGFEQGWKDGVAYRGRFTDKTWGTVGGGA